MWVEPAEFDSDIAGLAAVTCKSEPKLMALRIAWAASQASLPSPTSSLTVLFSPEAV
jgi:hypothetical protein